MGVSAPGKVSHHRSGPSRGCSPPQVRGADGPGMQLRRRALPRALPSRILGLRTPPCRIPGVACLFQVVHQTCRIREPGAVAAMLIDTHSCARRSGGTALGPAAGQGVRFPAPRRCRALGIRCPTPRGGGARAARCQRSTACIQCYKASDRAAHRESGYLVVWDGLRKAASQRLHMDEQVSCLLRVGAIGPSNLA